MIKCNVGFAPTHEGLNKCVDGTLTEATCNPTQCYNADAPAHGRKGGHWRKVLQSGEFNHVVCDEGYEPTNDGKMTCADGVLTEVTCKRQPNWAACGVGLT